jgi:MFS family permease
MLPDQDDPSGTMPVPETRSRFYYGYVIVAAAFLVTLVSWGTYSVYGVFFKPLLNDFGWSRTVTSGAFSVSTMVQGILGVVVGTLSDRFGPRVIISICGLLIGVGYFLMAQINTLWQLYLVYGLIVGIGMSGIWVPSLSCISRWFIKKRSFMTGVVIGGVGVGGTIAPPIMSQLIENHGWRFSYLALGAVILVVTILFAQLLKRDPQSMHLLPYGFEKNPQPQTAIKSDSISLKKALSQKQFWLLFFMIFCFGFGMFAMRIHIVPHATDLGIPALIAANILAVSGATGIPGNFILGGLGDIIGNRKVFIIGFCLMAAALFWLLISSELWMLYLFAVLFGLTFGMGAVEPPLCVELFGLKSLGMIFGAISLAYTTGAAVGPIIAGYIYDSTHSYFGAILLSAVIGIIGVILAILIKPRRQSN